MSCITEILKLKGDNPILKYDHGVAVEGGGNYKGYEYLVTFFEFGHRCGYVAIPSSHEFSKYQENDYDKIDINVHGGLTFCSRESSLKDILSSPCTDLWIGFDCMHGFDDRCLKTSEKYFGEENRVAKTFKILGDLGSFSFNESSHRSFEYVETECKSIIDQLIAKECILNGTRKTSNQSSAF